MDTIQQIVQTFSSEDRADFKRFLKRTKSNEDRKDLQLFELMTQLDSDPKSYAKKLYPQLNPVAYQAVRKRLQKLLTRFIALKLIDNDSSEASGVLSLVNVARYLFAHSLSSLGWKYLEKAEKMALKNDLFEILNSIYVLQIQYLPPKETTVQVELIEKWKANKVLLEQNEQSEIALSIVSGKIDLANQSGVFQDIESMVRHTLKELGLSHQFLMQPRFVYHLAAVNRKRLLVKKDFFNLEPFLVQQYQLIEKQDGFQQKHSFYKLGFLYMIAHTLFRNKKFESALTYIIQLEQELSKAPKSLKQQYLGKAMLLKANVLLFSNRIQESILLLDQLSTQKEIQLANPIRLNTIINTGIAFFYEGNYRKALRKLMSITHTDKWCEKIMGKEWVLKKTLMEVLLYIELEEWSLVDSRLRYVRRSYRQLLQQEQYRRVNTYLSFLRQVSLRTDSDFGQMQVQLEQAFDWIPMEYEDLQAVGFYAWLKARLHKRSNYEVLLELLEQAKVKAT